MCGIAGIVAPHAQRHRAALERMTRALSHRGPDAEALHFFENCALGHRRLSIVDLSTGNQPMLSPDSGCGVIFNGEIYGYKEVRAACSGYPFRTASDTEVILALYAEHQDDLAVRLPGMFAFALWDDAAQSLFCARDRFGEKPFYYAFGSGGEFLFASEIKALLASGLIRPILNPDAVAHYLQHLYVDPHSTIYANVHVLPPGHSLTHRAGRVEVRRYWAMPAVRPDLGMADAVEEFRCLLDRAVANQLVADVPVGAFLSGGLDSTTVVALAARHHSRLRTFSFEFRAGPSELAYARAAADRYGTQHTELSDDGRDLGDLLWEMQRVYDEPFGDSSNIPTYLIAQEARKHITVVLTGDGGDELLAGYTDWYQPLLRLDDGAAWGAALRRALARSLRLAQRAGLPVALPPGLRHDLRAARLAGRYGSPLAAHVAGHKYIADADLNRLGLSAPGALPSGDFEEVLRWDVAHYMAGDILVKTDRAAMAHGLELRAPFLDVEFARFCLSLPARLKLSRASDKLILRAAFADEWPPAVRSRGKLGFGAPVPEWLATPSLDGLVQEYVLNPARKVYELLDYAACRSIVRRRTYQEWSLLVLSLWLESHDFQWQQT